MRISFDAAGTPAEFRWSSTTGDAQLQVGAKIIPLQDPLRLPTHFGLRTERAWKCRIGGHDIEILKVRPRWAGGLRKNSFTICVDSTVVAEASGR